MAIYIICFVIFARHGGGVDSIGLALPEKGRIEVIQAYGVQTRRMSHHHTRCRLSHS
jgi:hypothetical protein